MAKLENSNMNNGGKKTFKLEQLDRNNIFKVPDNYFEDLPSIIQAKVIAEKQQSWISKLINLLAPTPAIRLAYITAVIVLIAVFSGLFIGSGSTVYSVDELLSEVAMDDLIDYLDYSEISTEEILAQVDLSQLDDSFFDDDIQLLNENELEEISLDELNDEFGLMESDLNDL